VAIAESRALQADSGIRSGRRSLFVCAATPVAALLFDRQSRDHRHQRVRNESLSDLRKLADVLTIWLATSGREVHIDRPARATSDTATKQRSPPEAAMRKETADLIDRIAELPADWHGAGTMGRASLTAIARHAERIGPLRQSAETGSGKSTLLFSHLSSNHQVFAVDDGDSISQVRNSSLFRSENVTFVEGPTQITLARHSFPQKLQLVLIDGPHGYPFPDLEYYHFYPVIEPGGLLLVDDLPIPSIARMFEIIRADDMFELHEVVEDQLAIFSRTTAPLIDPQSDSWWLQGYNRQHYEGILAGAAPPSALESIYGPPLKFVLRGASAVLPKGVKALLSENVKKKLWSRM
jgi:hypothetical protein